MVKKKIGRGLKDIFSGDFITRLGLERYIGFVAYIFLLVCTFIFWNLMVESNLVKVVDGENQIKELKIYRDQTAIELLKLDHRSTVEELLKANGSSLQAPTEPATVIEGGNR